MSNDTTSDMILKVHDYQPSTDVITQYGMRYPDGTIRWGCHDVSLNSVHFDQLRKGLRVACDRWDELLQRKAKDASLDLEDYKAQHQMVKRTVIVAVTVNEEI